MQGKKVGSTKLKIKQIKLLSALLALLVIIITVISGQAILSAYAEDTYVVTSALKDLQKDSSFDVNDYPIDGKDYSLNVIQVAEGIDGNLYLYTYQPCNNTKHITATQINMSLSETAEGTKLYDLTLVSTSGIFCKYEVKGVTISNAAVRYYNISTIYRDWDKTMDGITGNDNTTTKKSYEVGKIFKAVTTSDGVTYSMNPTYVVNIIDPYVDYLIYTAINEYLVPPIFQLMVKALGAIDAHYIAFSTDMQIDKLMSATVTYNYCEGTGNYQTFWGFDCGSDVKYGAEQTAYAYPTYEDKYEKEGHLGIKTYSFTWDRIQTVEEFMASEKDLRDETKSNLAGKQWVLRFAETARTQTELTTLGGFKNYTTNFTKVSSVAILRLEFEADGIVYNIGAVGDVQTGDDIAGNETNQPAPPSSSQTSSSQTSSFWQGVEEFIANCFVHTFSGSFQWWELTLVIVFLMVALAVVVFLIKFIKWVIEGIFN